MDTKINSKKKAAKESDTKDVKMQRVRDIIAKHNFSAQQLIPILQEVQDIYNYLPQDVMEYIAEKLGITAGHVFGVATFYAHFTLTPKGKYVIRVCDGTACHVKQSETLIKTVETELKLDAAKRASDDGLFTLETVACLGSCGTAPVVVINEEVHGNMTKEKTVELIKNIRLREKGAAAK